MPRPVMPRLVAGTLLAALPWLNPFSAGPSPAVDPWLTSCACLLALCLLARAPGPLARPGLLAIAVGTVLWAVVSHAKVQPETVFLAAGLALVVLAAGIVDDPDIGQALQLGLLLAASASAVIALLQYFGLAEPLRPWVNGAQVGEAYANLRQPNHFGSLCWIGAAVLLFGTLRLPRAAAFALMVLLAVASAASVSRTGIVQGFMLTLLAAVWQGPQRRDRLQLCLAAGIAYFAATWMLPELLRAITGVLPARTLWGRIEGGDPCTSRLVLWSNVLRLIALRPLTGWGWGDLDYAHFMTLYPGARFCDILDNAHNLPLHLAVELGVPAALVLCAIALLWAWRQQPRHEQAPLRRLAWALLALVLLHSLLEYPLWYGPFQIVVGAALGWLIAPRDEAAGRSPGFIAVVCVLFGVTAYAAWDYQRVSQIYLEPEQRRAMWREDTLDHVRKSWLFRSQARFAELTLLGATRANAPEVFTLSEQMLHYSPEPRVIERAIESLVLLGRDDEAVLDLARYRAAFPKDYEAWREAQKKPSPLLGAPGS
ncbi:polymerase [Ramlibacter sp. G-1-2-2]|uniref:Polymerase n=1 Tax=Ramlibacter agri TaxID=2728837 RepID=A0A848H1V4_9BURK|nr:Wzy polymerase domain-containing protein [Ramlibacter agri]NML42713.1 polymerase [Ramlibacter agri]